MDAGPVYAQQNIALSCQESKPELAQKLLEMGSKLLIDNLEAILDGSRLKPQPQNEAEASYTKLLTKANGIVKFDEPAEVIERKVRAYLGFSQNQSHRPWI